MRTHYRNGDEIHLKGCGCDGCQPLMIQGILCHETGCPFEWKDDLEKMRLEREMVEDSERFFLAQDDLMEWENEQVFQDCCLED